MFIFKNVDIVMPLLLVFISKSKSDALPENLLSDVEKLAGVSYQSLYPKNIIFFLAPIKENIP